MYTLVKFYDGMHYMCSSKSVYATKSGIKVKYSDGYRYSATVSAKNGKKANFTYYNIFLLYRSIYT